MHGPLDLHSFDVQDIVSILYWMTRRALSPDSAQSALRRPVTDATHDESGKVGQVLRALPPQNAHFFVVEY